MKFLGKQFFCIVFVFILLSACSDKQNSEKNKVEIQQDSKWVVRAKKLTIQTRFITE